MEAPASEGAQRDRAVLVALYAATGGARWTIHTNWLSTAPIGAWHGVTTDANGRVTRLELDDNNLWGILPAALGRLEHLQRLELSENGLTGPLPAALGRLSCLTELKLWNNGLTGLLPVELGQLSRLKQLWLSENCLTGLLPAELGRLGNLKRLDLSENDLAGFIPAELGQLDNLQRLWLAGNRLKELRPQQDRAVLVALYHATGGAQWMRNASWLSDAPLGSWHGVSTDANGRVTELSLSENNLTGTLPAELGQLGKLEELDLSKNNLRGPLPLSLTGLTALVELHFDNTELCAPRDRAFQEWLGGMSDVSGANC